MLSTAIPYLSKHIVDTLSVPLLSSVSFAIVFLGLFWTLEKTLNYLQTIIFFPVLNILVRDLTFNVVQHIHHLPLTLYQGLSIPEIISSLKRIHMSAQFFIKTLLLMIIPTIIKVIIAINIAIHLGSFGWILLPTFMLILFALYQGTQWYIRSRANAWQITDDVTMRIHDSIANTKLVRQFFKFENQALGTVLSREAQCWYSTILRQQIVPMGITCIMGISFSWMLFQASRAVLAGSISVGDFVLLKGQLIAVFLPLKTLALEFRQLNEAMIDIEKIANTLALPIETPQAKTNNSPYPEGIRLEKVSFSYPTIDILRSVSLYIPLGQKLGIIGDNGSGKSSLLNLIAGLQPPSDGKLSLQGLAHSDLHLISQDIRMFNLSIRYNLNYGMTDVSDDKLWKVLQKVGLYSLVKEMKQGLDTLLGDFGIRLSGGEKQRLLIAHALLLSPKVLLLDETLSSLDADAEIHLLEEIFKSIPTVIVVTHRPSTLLLMDAAIKLEARQIKHVTEDLSYA